MSASGTITPVATWVANPRVCANGDSSDASTWVESAQDLANREEYLHDNSALLADNNVFTGENTFSDNALFSASVEVGTDLDVVGDTRVVGLSTTGAVLFDASIGTDFTFNATTGQVGCGQITTTEVVCSGTVSSDVLAVDEGSANPIAINATVGSQAIDLNDGMVEVHINKNADANHTVTLTVTSASVVVGGCYQVAVRHYHSGFGSGNHTYVILGTSGGGITVKPNSTSHADAMDFPVSHLSATYSVAMWELRVMSSDGAGNKVVIAKLVGPYDI